MEIREQLLELAGGRGTPFMLTYKDGIVRRVRLFKSSKGDLCVMFKGSRRQGTYFNSRDVVSFKLINKGARIKKLTPAQQYVRELLTRKKYINKHCHHNLWPELRAEVSKITDENTEKFIQDSQAQQSSFHAWQASAKYNLPQIEGHKTLSLKTALGKYNGLSFIMDSVREAIENKRDFSYRWRNGYDYNVEVKFTDGMGHAWLSQEFKDCGNGHYWLLINSNNAIFCEND